MKHLPVTLSSLLLSAIVTVSPALSDNPGASSKQGSTSSNINRKPEKPIVSAKQTVDTKSAKTPVPRKELNVSPAQKTVKKKRVLTIASSRPKKNGWTWKDFANWTKAK